jgi:hypothetical protein
MNNNLSQEAFGSRILIKLDPGAFTALLPANIDTTA